MYSSGENSLLANYITTISVIHAIALARIQMYSVGLTYVSAGDLRNVKNIY